MKFIRNIKNYGDVWGAPDGALSLVLAPRFKVRSAFCLTVLIFCVQKLTFLGNAFDFFAFAAGLRACFPVPLHLKQTPPSTFPCAAISPDPLHLVQV